MGRWIFVLLFLFVNILFVSNASPVAEADPNPDVHINIQVNLNTGDKTIAEVPTCRSGTDCLIADVCPDIAQFPANYYVCKRGDGKNCITKSHANKFMNRAPVKPADNPYILFASQTFDGNDISYISTGTDRCKIKKDVQIWSCTWNTTTTKWSCDEKGFCTADIKKVGDGYKPDGNSLECPCPNPRLKQKHICSDCQNKNQALTFTINNRPNDTGSNTVLAGQPDLVYKQENTNAAEVLCKITSPLSVTAWQVTKHNGVWDESEDLGECNNLESALKNGHLFFDRMKCYKVHLQNIWEEGDGKCDPLKSIILDPDTPANCMKKCTADTTCNAFNYMVKETCTLLECPEGYEPVPNTEGYDAYYRFAVPTAARSNIANDED